MANVFKRSKSGPEGSDCTACYRISLIGEPSVEEVIVQILGKTDEWGVLTICAKDGRFEEYMVDYRYGKMDGQIKAEHAGCMVKRASAAGGWTRMDYTLWI